MRSPDELRVDILSIVRVMPPVEIRCDEVAGCVLAEDVVSRVNLPGFDNSAMDGYAVRSEDVIGADPSAPIRLRVLGDIAAGTQSAVAVTSGTALRIMTGAPLPSGADAVIKVEETDGGTETVLIQAPASIGRNVRRAGEDVSAGATVLRRGTALGPRQIGLLSAIGRASVQAHRQPMVVVIPTGDELVNPGKHLAPGAIYDSNGPMLASLVRATGAQATVLAAVPDDADAFSAAIEQAAATADLIVTTGGVSMGAYDTVKAVLTSRGGVRFEKIAMQPGMPQGFGHIDGTPIITLPGNPVSVFVSFEAFVRPAIRAMQGHARTTRPERTAECTVGFESPAGKVQFARAIVEGDDRLTVAPVGMQGSHVMGGLASANAVILVPADCTWVEAGETVRIWDMRGES